MNIDWYEMLRGMGVGGVMTSLFYVWDYYRKKNVQGIVVMLIWMAICLSLAIIFWSR